MRWHDSMVFAISQVLDTKPCVSLDVPNSSRLYSHNRLLWWCWWTTGCSRCTNLQEYQKCVAVIMDEMHYLVYNKHSGAFTNLGNHLKLIWSPPWRKACLCSICNIFLWEAPSLDGPQKCVCTVVLVLVPVDRRHQNEHVAEESEQCLSLSHLCDRGSGHPHMNPGLHMLSATIYIVATISSRVATWNSLHGQAHLCRHKQ